MAFTNQHAQLERELEDIQMKQQEFNERERRVREELERVNASSSPIAINTNARLSHQNGGDMSFSAGGSYQLAGGDGWRYQSGSAPTNRATLAMTPRSQSNVGVRMSALSVRPDTNMVRSRSSISALSHPMSRSVSQTSDLSRAPLNPNNASLFPGANTGMMDRLREHESASSQLHGGRARHWAGRLAEVHEDPLPDIGQNPMDYIMSNEDDSSSYGSTSFSGATYYTPNHSTGDYLQYPTVLTSITSSTPSLVSNVDSAAAPEAVPLTRDNSFVGDSFADTFEIARLDSTDLSITRSASQDPFGRDFSHQQFNAGAKHPIAAAGNSYLFGVGANLAGPPTAQNYPDPDDAASADMRRSISNTSIRSTGSNQERRAKEARERQVQNGLRNTIAPKPTASSSLDKKHAAAPAATPASHHAVKKEGSGRTAVAPSTGKGQYQRPKHPKVYCDRCPGSDGFRGEHELRRHVNSKHSATVVKYVCCDPAESGVKAGVAAVNPLSKCKSCVANKQYGAYYNAAAHLRRAHFRKRASRGRAAGKAGEETERRAGKGGGDWPPMEELKHWMRKVHVRGNVIVGVETEDGSGTFAPQDIDLATYGNGGGLDYSGLDASPGNYPPMLPELAVDVSGDGSSTEGGLMAPPSAGGLSPFSSFSPFSPSVPSMSPLEQELGFQDEESFGALSSGGSHSMSPAGAGYMEFQPMDEYNMGLSGV
ncbi:uncharacterized protein DNG_07975 [Cephalotrichum gorgonifer]|uniref:DUF7896 domain-containing protein n=1 Tax=Cephalotrichum gorgonifer TaxID=2041049 RepID=A0AAE8N562_9PEZI|nr:uncharacterized protein DNG_07975 [Cephalotrichum gorgonifer]